MSTDWGATVNEGGDRRGWGERAGRCGRWKAAEIAVMVLGFMVYWPIGLAMLGFKFWQRKSGYRGDFGSFARESWSSATAGRWSEGPWARGACSFRSAKGWRRHGWRPGRTGNTAFDDWRDGELARLEEERRKLEAAEREFSDYIENLRRAKDREEFDRFMRERKGPGENSPPVG
ncbi:MAG TPA: DUF2852 domain-containing protein [Beijerinckiaceae bacterium]|nr:DUF2852 domain-containing protein [Beijerinckiaceae bacterium]